MSGLTSCRFSADSCRWRLDAREPRGGRGAEDGRLRHGDGDPGGGQPLPEGASIDYPFNLKTGKALGLTIPPSLLGRADEVIQ